MAVGGVVTIEGNVGEVLAVTTTSGQTGALSGGQIDVSVDAEMFVALGVNPTAVVPTATPGAGYRLLAGATYRFSTTDGHKLAAIVASGTGNLWVHSVS